MSIPYRTTEVLPSSLTNQDVLVDEVSGDTVAVRSVEPNSYYHGYNGLALDVTVVETGFGSLLLDPYEKVVVLAEGTREGES